MRVPITFINTMCVYIDIRDMNNCIHVIDTCASQFADIINGWCVRACEFAEQAASSVQLRAEHAHSLLARVDRPIPRPSSAVLGRLARYIQSNTGGIRKHPIAAFRPGGLTTADRSAWVCQCACAHEAPLTRRAVVQAGGWDGAAVAAREDRRAQEAEEPVRHCAHRELYRAVPQCGAGSSTDVTLRSSPIRSATSQF
jgi:hypothetical protein